MSPALPTRPRSTLLVILLLWLAFYASVTLFTPPLLDDADSVHAEVAREMLFRRDYITLYANGIRYLEKAPLFYWSMALSMKLSMTFGAVSPRALAVAARIPLALSILGLALLVEALARRISYNSRAGLYATLITLSSSGIFLFTRILIPDALVCLWTTLAMYALWRTEEPHRSGLAYDLSSQPQTGNRAMDRTADTRAWSYLFAIACALNVLTKGLIGVVFPVAVALLYFAATRGLRGTPNHIRNLYPLSSLAIFFIIAAPWHILVGLANPAQGHPTPFHFVHGRWIVPLPTEGNVRGWFWFYFMNEHLLRYLNLRVPHDYDTAPLWLFWGLCILWLMPWSAYLYAAARPSIRSCWWAVKETWQSLRSRLPLDKVRIVRLLTSPREQLLTLIWAVFTLLFFSLSTRQEYYVLPALPALAILIGCWVAANSPKIEVGILHPSNDRMHPAAFRSLFAPLFLGTVFFIGSVFFLLHAKPSPTGTDLATLLTQNPSDYALSLGHFLDLTGPAITLFRFPLMLAALSLFLGPLVAFILRQPGMVRVGENRGVPYYRRTERPHAANIALAAGAFGFLISVFLGLRIFSPVLTSAQLAEAIAPHVKPQDLICIHGEYESGSTLAFYLERTDIHILEGRSSNLWYGSFFPDAPPIFETQASIAQKWSGQQRIFLLQSLTDPPNKLPALPGPVYILVKNGGKEILSNQPNR